VTRVRAAAALPFVLAFALSGCAMRVSGFVTDSVTGDPVQRGTVKVGDRYAPIDSAGHFSIKTRFNTRDRFVFAAPGYVTQTVKVKHSQEQRFRDLDIRLVPESEKTPMRIGGS
jgi:hypothetical protein